LEDYSAENKQVTVLLKYLGSMSALEKSGTRLL